MSDGQSGVSGDENEIEQGREDDVDKGGKGVSNRKDERKLSKEDRQEVLTQAHLPPRTCAHTSHPRQHMDLPPPCEHMQTASASNE